MTDHATLVTRPLTLRTDLLPVFMSVKQPVPYVFFAWPGTMHAWPSRAAAWSPALPQTGMPSSDSSPGRPAVTCPYTMDDGTGTGSMLIGMPRRAHSSSSQQRLSMSNSIVREQLE